MTILIDVAVRASLVLLAGLAASALLRRRSAALRHWVVTAALFAAIAVVPLGLVLPSWDLPLAGAASTPSPSDSPASATGMRPAPHHGPEAVGTGTRVARGVSASTLVMLAWAAGVCAAAAVLLTGLARLRWVGTRAERVHEGRWARVAAQISSAHGLTRTVTILQTDVPDLLATWGLFRPRVLLPEGAGAWSEARVRAVLCHELAHVRRHDWLVQMSAEALRAVLWFNPIVWMVCTRLRRDSERACDDAVLGDGVPPHEYATHLLEVARGCRRAGPTWAAPATPMARPSTLEGRVAAMLNPGLDRMIPTRRALALTVVLLAAVTLPIAALRSGQGTSQPLKGSVYDSSGAVLPGVDLSLESATEIKWTATTDATGRFEFPPVEPGRYVLEASIPGFRPLRHEFALSHRLDWDRAVTLQVGDVRETIMVRVRRAATPPSTTQAPPTAVRVGGNVRPPRKLRDVKPVYPPTMRDAGLEGVVPIEAIIGRDGTVQSARVASAQVHPDFAQAALGAVRQWRFDPTLLNGVPVEVLMMVSVQFRLSD